MGQSGPISENATGAPDARLESGFRMQKFKQRLVLCLLTVVVCAFQACTGCDTTALKFAGSSSGSQSSANDTESGGDGRPIQGKPGDGTYYRHVPGFACGGKFRVHSRIEVSNESAKRFTVKDSDCSDEVTDLPASQFTSSRLTPTLLVSGPGVYELAEQTPDPEVLDQARSEAYCTVRQDQIAVDFAVTTNPATSQTVVRAAAAVRSGTAWTLVPPSSATVTHEARANVIEYSAPGLQLRIERNRALPMGAVSGTVQGSYAGRQLSGDVECRTAGWHDVETIAKPSFSLDLSGGVLPSTVAYSRTGPGTFVNASGQIVVAPAGSPRFDHHPVTREPLGVLVEPARTNMLIHSNDPTNAVWETIHTSITREGQLVGLDRWRIEKNDPAYTENFWRALQWADFDTSRTYTASVYAERGNIALAKVLVWQAPGNEIAFDVDLTNGNVIAPYTNGPTLHNVWTAPAGNGYRIFVSFQTTVSRASFGIGPSSTTVGHYIYFAGAQVEEGVSATSLILTADTPVTRGADVLSLPNTNWFDPAKGTIQLNVSRPSLANVATSPVAVSLQGGADAYTLGLDSSGVFQARMAVGGQTSMWTSSQAPAAGPSALQKLSLAYTSGNAVLGVGGSLTSGPANAPVNLAPTSVVFGGSGARVWDGHVKSFTFWPQRLSDELLTKLGE